jgi:hypothetical protein
MWRTLLFKFGRDGDLIQHEADRDGHAKAGWRSLVHFGAGPKALGLPHLSPVYTAIATHPRPRGPSEDRYSF